MYEIEVHGLASKSLVKVLKPSDEDLSKNLMDYLRVNNLPIASSCLGKMQCEKCVINGFLLSCSVTVKEYFRISSQPLDAQGFKNKFLITIDYL